MWIIFWRPFNKDQGVQLPRLEELYIIGWYAGCSRAALSWTCPNLRSLRCTDLHPIFLDHIFFSDDVLFHIERK